MITLKKAGNAIMEPAREIPLEREYDVVVTGGGIAGAGAGIAALGHSNHNFIDGLKEQLEQFIVGSYTTQVRSE